MNVKELVVVACWVVLFVVKPVAANGEALEQSLISPPLPSSLSSPPSPSSSSSLSFPSLPTSLSAKRVSPRIIGGEDVVEGQYPWMVSLRRTRVGGHHCGGTLIDTQFVLTAAHCVEASLASTPLVAWIGAYDFASSASANVATVTDIVRHPSYDPTLFLNDVAVLRLEAPVNVAPVSAVSSAVASEVVEGDTATVLGFGATGLNPEVFPNVLQEAAIPIVNFDQCRESYEALGFVVNDTMLCASQESPVVDACNGDSGGPLLLDVAGEIQQLGLVSFGDSSCDPTRLAGVYAEISNFERFIEQAKQAAIYSVDFGYLGMGRQTTVDVTVVSWSAELQVESIITAPDFVEGVNFGDCFSRTLGMGESCTLTLTVEALETGYQSDSLLLSASGEGAPSEIEVVISGWVLAPFSAARAAVDNSDARIEWFTGGDLAWSVSTSTSFNGDSSLQSGRIRFPQESILLAYVAGPGYIGFMQKVNQALGDNLLEVIVRKEGRTVGFQSFMDAASWGFVGDFNQLSDGEHELLFRFTTDSASGETSRAAFIDRFQLSSEPVSSPNASSSGGPMSTFWLWFGLLLFLCRYLSSKKMG